MQYGFTKRQKNDLIYYVMDSFEKTGLVKHCFTTKHGGVSTGDCASMNLGLNRGDNRESVVENYKIMADALEINCDDFVLSNQVHKTNIHFATRADVGKGINRDSDIFEIDAFVTNEKNVALVTFYADCVPLYFLDPIKKAIGLAHSGWRGTIGGIGEKTVEKMVEEFGSKPSDILVGIAPSISVNNFEVGQEVYDEFLNKYGEQTVRKKEGKLYVDLWQANVIQLIKAGIVDDNITLANLCTYDNSDMFFSHRVTGDRRGNLGAIMQLINE